MFQVEPGLSWLVFVYVRLDILPEQETGQNDSILDLCWGSEICLFQIKFDSACKHKVPDPQRYLL